MGGFGFKKLPGMTMLAVTVKLDELLPQDDATKKKRFKCVTLHATFPVVLTDERRKDDDKRPR
jgi:hypothetical protein